MVHRCHGALRSAYAQSASTKLGEGLRGGHLVHEVKIDVQDGRRGGGLCAHDVCIPHLVEECSRRAHATSVGSGVAGSTNGAVASATRSRSVTSFCRSASDLSRSKMLVRHA